MKTASRILAVALAAAIARPAPSLSCLHGASLVNNEAFQTGELLGQVRVEKLAAKYDGHSPNIVKFFVAPRNAKVVFDALKEEDLKRHADLNKAGNNVLNPPLTTRGDNIIAKGGLASAVATYKTKSGIDAAVYDVTNLGWAAIKADPRFGIEDSSNDRHYEEWVKRAGPEEGRGLFAVAIDMSKPENKINANEALALVVRIPYSATGAALKREIALDKWIEYRGTYDQPVIFATGWKQAAVLDAFQKVLANDWDLADDQDRAEPRVDGSNSHIVLVGPNRSRPLITFTLDSNGNIIYKNASYRLGPHTVDRPPRTQLRPQARPRINEAGINKILGEQPR